MRITLTSAAGPRSATRWRDAEPTSSIDRPVGLHDRYEARVVLLPGEDGRKAFDRVRDRLFRYDVFPPAVMAFSILPPGEVAGDALIVQRFGLGPPRLEFAVRVVEAWHRHAAGAADAGFTYVTLNGHPERGTESFRVQLGSDGRVVVTIEAWSEPATALVSFARPLARMIQVAVTRAALRRLSEP
ncbi:MAG TPA: DUF1990 family protein [Candidatus Dormibacteraeota bacterium]|nr:DUF1990 family protein [Candidatus Dormibacteraeota bacterium]